MAASAGELATKADLAELKADILKVAIGIVIATLTFAIVLDSRSVVRTRAASSTA